MSVEALSTQSTAHNPDFKEIGYDEKAEIESLFRIININLAEGKSLAEAVSIAAGELELNLRGYNLEIIEQRPVLPHSNRIDIKDNRLRMVGSSGEPVVNAVTTEERNGSVKEASKKIEDFLLFAPNNSIAVLMNPSGWNGFKDAHGREAEPHLNSETMVFWKDKNGALKGLTLVTDLKEEQAKQTMVSLGVTADTPGVEEHDRLANIVRNPALISFFGTEINPFEYVLDKILAQRGLGNIMLRQRTGSFEIWSVEQVRKDIDKFEELLSFSLEKERLVTEPKRYILEQMQKLREKSVRQKIINKIEQAILSLAGKHLEVTNKFEYYRMKTLQISGRNRDFAPIMLFLRSRGGCSAAVRALSGRMGSMAGLAGLGESDSMGSLYFPCPVCGAVNKRPYEGFVESCQSCGSKAVACKLSAAKTQEEANKEEEKLAEAA